MAVQVEAPTEGCKVFVWLNDHSVVACSMVGCLKVACDVAIRALDEQRCPRVDMGSYPVKSLGVWLVALARSCDDMKHDRQTRSERRDSLSIRRQPFPSDSKQPDHNR